LLPARAISASAALPRLPDFHARHPETELHLHTTTELADFGRDGVDLAIRYGRGAWPGTASEKLLDAELIPVCSPQFNHGRLPAMAAEILAQDDLAAGRLVRLPGAALAAGAAYYIVQPSQTPLSPDGQAFGAWLRRQARFSAE